MNRRNFIKNSALATSALMAPSWMSADNTNLTVPSYLKGYEDLYQSNPRGAATQWFRDAKFGLFLHYGLYSQLGRGEWVMINEKIHVAEYAKLKDNFTAEKFDADAITDLALAAEMKYINITTRHHDCFCLFETKQTDFNSLNSPAKRDLVAELAQSCRDKGLGLCLYYSHGRDWTHPHAPNNDNWGGSARPKYATPEPNYAYGKDHDLQKYLDFMTAQVTELLTQYGPVAAIWLDGIGVPFSGDKSKFKAQELYDHIHSLQPQVLISYKQGLLGTEDFFAPEHKVVANKSGKPMEICTTLQNGGWGYKKNASHAWPNKVMKTLAEARKNDANLLLNTGPLPDGSIYPQDEATLREVGKRIRANGFPV
ncbi:MAG: alpha-L-fucosidase [Opitutaceae bacterium]